MKSMAAPLKELFYAYKKEFEKKSAGTATPISAR
jgi:hypothetical protein